VALDARSLQGHPIGGVGRAVRGSIEGLRDEVDFVLLTDARRDPIEIDLEQRALRAPLSAHMAAWLQVAVPPALRGFDGIFHCPWYGLPRRQPVPMVVTLHDLSFELYPEWFSRGRLFAYRTQARLAARTAAGIVTHAEAIRQEVLDHYRVEPARVTVAPAFVEAERAGVPEEVRRRAAGRLGIDGRHIVAIGGAERRNLVTVLHAWPAVHARHPDVSLIVLGGDDSARPGLPGVIPAGSVDESDWIGLIAGAELLAYPSLYEGFGHPAAEAIVNGVPVVCARRGSLPEVVGPAGRWLDELSAEALGSAVIELLSDEPARRALCDAALIEAGRLTDPRPLAEGTLAAYELAEAARRRS
jgi:glycosyltransferase involved in cell wall biosynthesis